MNPDKDLVIPAAVLADGALSPAAKLVYGRLLFLARAGGLVFMSRFALAGQVGISEKAAESALAALERRRYVVCEVSEGGRNRPRGYRVRGTASKLAMLPPVPAKPEPRRTAAQVRQLTLFDTTLGSDGGGTSPGDCRASTENGSRTTARPDLGPA